MVLEVLGNVKTFDTVVSMKFSYHGAATSTPHDLLDNFKPVNITISQGKHQGLGHPHMLIFSHYICIVPCC